jgi:hypothetical protein
VWVFLRDPCCGVGPSQRDSVPKQGLYQIVSFMQQMGFCCVISAKRGVSSMGWMEDGVLTLEENSIPHNRLNND